jgi:hypothetical protein
MYILMLSTTSVLVGITSHAHVPGAPFAMPKIAPDAALVASLPDMQGAVCAKPDEQAMSEERIKLWIRMTQWFR